MKKFLILAAAAALAGSASAATIFDTDTLQLLEGQNNTISLDKFNIPGQTLTSIEITITLTLPSFDTEVDNDSGNGLSGNVINFGTLGSPTFSASVNTINTGLTDFIDGTDFNVTTQTSGPFDVTATSGDLTSQFDNTGLGDYYKFSTTTVNVGDTGHFVNSSVFSQYEGPGTVDFTLNADFSSDFNPGTGGGGGGETRFQGTIPSATYTATITYTYIPEPSSAALVGLVGVGALLRRRRN